MYSNNYKNLNFEEDSFKNPPKDCAVVYTWIWNAPLSLKAIEEQIQSFFNAGIKGIYIIAEPENFRPMTKRTFLSPEYLSDEFMECIAFAYKCAEERGILLWLYDEGGFPSGGACGKTAQENPDAIMKVLQKEEFAADKDICYITDKEDIAVYCDGKRIYDRCDCKAGQKIVRYYIGRLSFGPNIVDITNQSVTDTFLKITHERYKQYLGQHFGKKLKLFFTDEPFLPRNTWGESFVELFTREYGYDITEYLDCICDENRAVSEAQQQARIDYGKLLGKLFKNNFFKRISNWCNNNSMMLCGHINYDDELSGMVEGGYFSTLDILRTFDIPGVDAIWQQIFPGKYNDSENCPFFPRMASSAANQNGTGLSLTESMAVYGEAITFDQMRYVLNYQLIRGINIFNMMVTAYGRMRGLALAMRPCFTPERPGFRNLSHFNKYFARASYLMRIGKAVCDTALYCPVNDIWANEKKRISSQKSYDAMGVMLEESHIEFDIVDDEWINDAIITSDGIKKCDVEYKHIVIPQGCNVPKKTLDKIKPFIGIPSADEFCSDREIMTKCRKTENGDKIYFVFNQSEKTKTVTVSVKEPHNLYYMDLQSGQILDYDGGEISLYFGETAVIINTQRILKTDNKYKRIIAEFTEFSKVKARRFVINENGISSAGITDADWSEDFSGEIEYECRYILNELPSNDKTYMIELQDTSVSATVAIDGEITGTCGISPMRVYFNGDKLKKSGKITITVANTAANELLNKVDVINTWDKAEVGPYNSRMIEFEKNIPYGKIGKAILYCID